MTVAFPPRATAVAAVLVLTCVAEARAQFPAELEGRVVEAGTSVPVEGARVEIEGVALVTDAAGVFRARGLDSGPLVVHVSRPGYEPASQPVVLTTGATVRVTIVLEPAPFALAPLEVVAAEGAAAPFTFSRERIETSGARTLAELVRAVPGVVVRSAGGAAQRVSIRGSATDAVLVLVDGQPLNDHVSGEADLSLVDLGNVESVRVLPGARSARFGPRAAGGVIDVRTRRAHVEPSAAITVGSLNERSLAAGGAFARGEVAGSVRARASARSNGFVFERSQALGGGVSTRSNADERSVAAALGLDVPLAGAPVRLRADALDLSRGLPGPMHAPTREARHDRSRLRASAGWVTSIGTGTTLAADLDAVSDRIAFRDPAPAVGAPYDDTIRANEVGFRVEFERAARGPLAVTVGSGTELRRLRLAANALEPGSIERMDFGLFARAGLDAARGTLRPALETALRVDRWEGRWVASHEVSGRIRFAGASIGLAHRSAFAPPSPGDQFFRAGYAIAPNPELQPERVPAEVELRASIAGAPHGIPFEVGGAAYRGDIRDMIVWAPDYRFVWSPRNRDAKRSGADAWARVAPVAPLAIEGWLSVVRATYDWPGDADTVQIAYRPRHTAGASVHWRPGGWSASLDARYTGRRFATPGPDNALAAFWDLDARIARRFVIGAAHVTAAVDVSRLFDNRDAFVHGYPEPGRTVRIELTLAGTD